MGARIDLAPDFFQNQLFPFPSLEFLEFVLNLFNLSGTGQEVIRGESDGFVPDPVGLPSFPTDERKVIILNNVPSSTGGCQ